MVDLLANSRVTAQASAGPQGPIEKLAMRFVANYQKRPELKVCWSQDQYVSSVAASYWLYWVNDRQGLSFENFVSVVLAASLNVTVEN
jgi:hypothetical protein